MKTFTLFITIMLYPIVSLVGQDWTATDINGNTHTLQDYLDEGKTVLVDVSAHWCPPCWELHNSGMLEFLYREFGPEGTDDLMIFTIDGDANSSIAHLTGNHPSSLGNWVEGVDWPIIGPDGQGAMIKNLYGVNSFPRFIMHCPDGDDITELPLSWSNPEYFFNEWREACSSAFINNADDATLLFEDYGICIGEPAYIRIKNMGSNLLSSADIEILKNNVVVGNYFWESNVVGSGNNMAYSILVPINSIEISEYGEYTARITSVNGNTQMYMPGKEQVLMYSESKKLVDATSVTIRIHTDYYPGQTSWELLNGSGEVVAGDSYSSGDEYLGGGGEDARKTFDYEVFLSDYECYTFVLNDASGNGFIHFVFEEGGGFSFFNDVLGYEIIDNSTYGAIVSNTYTSGTPSNLLNFSTLYDNFKTETLTSTELFELDETVKIYPNPVSDQMYLEFSDVSLNGDCRLEIYDLAGLLVYSGFIVSEKQMIIDVAEWTSGLYFVNLSDKSGAVECNTVMIR